MSKILCLNDTKSYNGCVNMISDKQNLKKSSYRIKEEIT